MHGICWSRGKLGLGSLESDGRAATVAIPINPSFGKSSITTWNVFSEAKASQPISSDAPSAREVENVVARIPPVLITGSGEVNAPTKRCGANLGTSCSTLFRVRVYVVFELGPPFTTLSPNIRCQKKQDSIAKFGF